MNRLEVNCKTGEEHIIKMTEAEVTQRSAEIVAAEAGAQVEAEKKRKRLEALERLRADPKMADVVER